MSTRHLPTVLRQRPLPAKGPYAPVPYCADHRTYAKGCDGCQRYAAWHKRLHSLRLANGERTTVPIAEVRAHLDKLAAAGMTPKMIQAGGPVHRSTLAGLLYKPGRRTVAEPVARRILAIPVPAQPATPPPRSHITDPTGTLRRVQALARIGWTYRHISAAAQTSHRLEHYAVQNSVTHETAAAIARAYDLLSMTPGPSSRVASRAAKFGWAPPLAWDDDTIGDPNAIPAEGYIEHRRPNHLTKDVPVDDVVVDRILDGIVVPSTTAERREVVRRWMADGRSYRALEALTGWRVERYFAEDAA